MSESDGHRPMPDVTPETAQYWEAASEGQLLLRECQDCGLMFHYPRALCPDCFGSDVQWRQSDGNGKIYSYSIARKLSGWPEDDLPLVVSYVELDEGPRMITNVDCDPDEIEVGTRVTVRFVDGEADDVAVPIFEPVTG